MCRRKEGIILFVDEKRESFHVQAKRGNNFMCRRKEIIISCVGDTRE